MENVFKSMKTFMIEQTTAWLNSLSTNIRNHEDFERAIETICEAADKLGASAKEIGTLIPTVQEDRITAIVDNVKKEKRFRVKKVKGKDDILVIWELLKYNSDNFVHIELMQENYIHIWGNDWNFFAYGYHSLESAIHCWAENRM